MMVASGEDFQDQEQSPTNRLVLSARAAQWLDGLLDSADYFSIARDQAYEAARREVGARLQHPPWLADIPPPHRLRG
jgi:hypothetical protein